MAKWNLIILLLLVIPLIPATTQIQYSEDNLTWKNVTSFNEQDKEGYQIALTEDTTYYFRGKNDNGTFNEGWGYIQQKTNKGVPPMVGDGIIWFLIILNGLLFLSPFFIRFAKKESINNIVKKSIWLLSLAFLAFVTTVVITMADTEGLGITQDLFMIHFIFVRGIYIGMILLFWNIMISTPKLWREEKRKARMGEE